MKTSFCMLGISIFILSCSKVEVNNKNIMYDSFTNEISLKGNRIGPNNHFLKPIQLSLFEDSVLVVNDDGRESYFTFLNMNNGKIIGEFGRKGNGPNEFIYPDLAQKKISNETLITNKAKFYSAIFCIDSMMINKNYFPDEKVYYPVNLIIPYNVIKIHDTLFVGQTSSGDCRFFTYNPYNKGYRYIQSHIEFPGSGNIKKSDLGQILFSSTDYNEKRKMLISSIRSFDRIDIFNAGSLTEDKTICNKNALNKQYGYNGELYSNETIFYYIDIQATDDFIFGLYFGKSFSDPEANVSYELHVFSWEGEAILKINLDIGISEIIINQDCSRLIGLDVDSEQPLVYYNLKDIL